MVRKTFTLAVLSLVFATSDLSGSRTRNVTRTPDTRPEASSVYGVVSAVRSNFITMAGGLIVIDATEARVVLDAGRNTVLADVKPGMIVFAAVTPGAAAGDPLRASLLIATSVAAATLAGPVDSVDLRTRTLTVLGRTIAITGETTFAGLRGGEAPGLDDILPNQLVRVQADVVDERLVARSVVVLSVIPPQVSAAKGTVKSINATAVVLIREGGSELEIAIDAQTRLVGIPAAGDSVEVIYRTDTANLHTAIAIIKLERVEVPQLTRVIGSVVSTSPALWIVKNDAGEDVRLSITERTRIEPGLRAGDRVDALTERRSDGSLTALLIVRRR